MILHKKILIGSCDPNWFYSSIYIYLPKILSSLSTDISKTFSYFCSLSSNAVIAVIAVIFFRMNEIKLKFELELIEARKSHNSSQQLFSQMNSLTGIFQDFT